MILPGKRQRTSAEGLILPVQNVKATTDEANYYVAVLYVPTQKKNMECFAHTSVGVVFYTFLFGKFQHSFNEFQLFVRGLGRYEYFVEPLRAESVFEFLSMDFCCSLWRFKQVWVLCPAIHG